MSSGGGWETVINKKGSKNLKHSSKGSMKSRLESMPRIHPIAPVRETPTIYQGFLEEELRKERKLLEVEKGQLAKGSKKLNVNQINKKKEKRMTLKDSILNIDLDEFNCVLKKDEVSFPKNPEIWLKDLVSLLNSKLDHINDSDPILADKPFGYPMCLMNDHMKDFFLSRLNGYQIQVYEVLMDHCIEFLMNGITKDQSSFGYRLIIQLLLQEHADIVLNNIPKYENLIQRNNGRPLRSLCILWSVGQIGYASLSYGLKIWFSLMFGLVAVKNLNEYVLSYLENLFESHPQLNEGHNALSKIEYFKFFGEIYSELSTVPLNVRKRLQLLYPKIKAIAWGDVSNNLNLFFLGYLTRLMPDCQEIKKAELLGCLVTCLEKDDKSFSHWKKEYHKNINQSSLLLRHIEANIRSLSLNKKLLIETVEAFQVINQDLAEKLPAKHSSMKSCNASCKAIILQKKSKSSTFKPYVLVMILLAAMLFSDAYVNGSLEDSFSHRCLLKFKAIPSVYTILHKCVRALSWVETNVLHWLNHLCGHVEMLLNHPKIRDYVSNGITLLRGTMATMTDKVIPYMPILLQHLEVIAEFSLSSFESASTRLSEACSSLQSICPESIFVDSLHPKNVLKEMSQLLLVIRDGISDLYMKTQNQ